MVSWIGSRLLALGLMSLLAGVLLATVDIVPAEAICNTGRGRLPRTPPPPPSNYDRPGGGVTPGLREPADPDGGDTPDQPTTPSNPDDPSTPPTTPATPATPNVPGGPVTGPTMPSGPERARPARGNSAEWSWKTWWYFNRWQYMPVRNDLLRAHNARLRPVTGDEIDPMGSWDRRRAALIASHARPNLIAILRRDLSAGDLGIKAAASLALARVANDPLAVEAVMQAAEDKDMLEEVRRAAAFAIGLVRRTDPKLQMDGARLDVLRKRLFALVDSKDAPVTVQALAAMSLGMLADQPYGTALPPGLMVSHGLWKRLTEGKPGVEMTVALLTALGYQPSESAPDAVLEGLRAIVMGKRVGGRPWNAAEQSHALCALVRIGAPAWRPILFRMFAERRISAAVRRAAFISLGEKAGSFDVEERKSLVKAWHAGMRLSRDPLTQGLALIALGRILAADLRAGDGRVLQASDAAAVLLREAKTAPTSTRGFAVLALALAARDADRENADHAAFRTSAERALAAGMARAKGNAANLGAYAVAAGLMRSELALPTLQRILLDGNADLELRGFAAVACGQVGKAMPDTIAALKSALLDHHLGSLRREAALGLAFLTGTREAVLLRREIERRRHVHSHLVGHVALALGQMGDLDAVEALSGLLKDGRASHGARGAAAVGLGLLCDPEERPSALRLTGGVNYPARTVALQEALGFF